VLASENVLNLAQRIAILHRRTGLGRPFAPKQINSFWVQTICAKTKGMFFQTAHLRQIYCFSSFSMTPNNYNDAIFE